MSIDGDTAVVGAPAGDFPGIGGNKGFAYVFTRKGTVWTQHAKLTANDSIGYSVAVDGDTAVVGAQTFNAGAAYVFVRDASGDWTEPVQLTASDGMPEDKFGISVSVDGDTVLVGAYVDNGIYPGYAYVFTRSKTGWKQGAKLIPSDGVPNDYFGNGVSAHGNTAMVGAPGLNEMVGSVYEYHLDGKAGN